MQMMLAIISDDAFSTFINKAALRAIAFTFLMKAPSPQTISCHLQEQPSKANLQLAVTLAPPFGGASPLLAPFDQSTASFLVRADWQKNVNFQQLCRALRVCICSLFLIVCFW